MKGITNEAQETLQALMTGGLACINRAMISIIECESIATFEHETEAQAFALLKGNLRSSLMLLSVIEISRRDTENSRFHEAALHGITKGLLP
jgi:hypothetical protein